METILNELADGEAALDPRAVARDPLFQSSNVAQVYRAMSKGLRSSSGARIRLEHLRTAGGYRTTRPAIKRFVAALTGASPAPATVNTPSAEQRRRNVARKAAATALA